MARKPKSKKIKGTFCERTTAPKSAFDKRSFRYKKSGKAWVLIGCPKGSWQPKKRWRRRKKVRGKTTYVWEVGKCKIGTRSYKLLAPLGGKKRCPKGSRRVTK
jgi:hypothetical protein